MKYRQLIAASLATVSMILINVLGPVALTGASSVAEAKPQTVTNFTWTQQSPTALPGARVYANSVYDAATKSVVLFGGCCGSLGALNDTWTWNGTTWTQRNLRPAPPAREQAGMAYDAATATVVLFGGNDRGAARNDTWVGTGKSWTKESPVTSPSIRSEVAMAYDAKTRTVVLFGGCCDSSNNALGDTWSWNGTTWTMLAPSVSPPAQAGASLVYDQATQKLVLFSIDGTTWNWNGTVWSQQSPSAAPQARSLAAMAYDTTSGAVVLFGGLSSDGVTVLGDTWTWDGSTWTLQSPSPAPVPRFGAAMAGSIPTGGVVLASGSAALPFQPIADTWVGTGN